MRGRALALLVAIAGGMFVNQSPASGAAAVNGKIAYERSQNRGSRIYTINSDGSGLRRVSPLRGFSSTPAFSPDGTRLAFSRIEPGQGTWSINLANSDGTGRGVLVTRAFGPVWSPDGTKLAFTRVRNDISADVFVINVDGSGLTWLTPEQGEDFDPAWSPDGTKIAFVTGRHRAAEIYVMDADGSHQKRLTWGAKTPDYGPKWSPDGSRILFNRDELEGAGGDLFMMNSDGTEKLNLTNDPSAFESSPGWSPDSSKIVYSRFGRRSEQIYMIDADGSGKTQITRGGRSNFWPGWSPDGAQIAFISIRDGNDELYVMNSDGSSQTRLTETVGPEFGPVWQALPP